MQYRRTYIPGGTYFFTVVTYQRQPIFTLAETVDTLRNTFRYTMNRMPFTIVASVILPDQLHFICTLPEVDSDYSTRWRLIKSHFTHHWQGKGTTSTNASRHEKGRQISGSGDSGSTLSVMKPISPGILNTSITIR